MTAIAVALTLTALPELIRIHRTHRTELAWQEHRIKARAVRRHG